MPPTKISLLHATFRSPVSPFELKSIWERNAERPERIEHIFAMNLDDEESIKGSEGLLRTMTTPYDHLVTAVQNWNAAASLSSGELLFAISDDLRPPKGWDELIEKVTQPLNPSHQDFAIKITDSPSRRDTVLRHPIVSRAFYKKHGLFDEDFRGVHCDNDITLRALTRSVILDARNIEFEHHNPLLDPQFASSASHSKINSFEEYAHGQKTMVSKWGPFLSAAHLNRLLLQRSMPRFKISSRIGNWSQLFALALAGVTRSFALTFLRSFRHRIVRE